MQMEVCYCSYMGLKDKQDFSCWMVGKTPASEAKGNSTNETKRTANN